MTFITYQPHWRTFRHQHEAVFPTHGWLPCKSSLIFPCYFRSPINVPFRWVKSLAFLVTQRRPAASVSNCQGTEKPTNNWKLRTKKIHTSLTFLGALGTRVGKNRQNMDFQQGVSVQKTWDTPNVYTCMYIYIYNIIIYIYSYVLERRVLIERCNF
jgi:hypothetical protein